MSAAMGPDAGNTSGNASGSPFALLSTESLVGPVIDASLDAVVIADLDGRILRVNPAAEAIFGHAPGSMVGRSIGDAIVPAHLRAAHDRGMAHHASTGERKVIGRRLELEALHGDGHHFPVEIQIEEVLQGEQRVYAAFVRDLTERRAMEAEVARQRDHIHQQEKLAALGTLLGGVAHELNNPLSVVIGRAAILEEALAGTAEARTVLKLREAAGRCHRIVRTFLAMARDTRPRQGEVELGELLAGVLEFSGYNLRTAGIAVTTAFDPALRPIRGDHDQLVQAFVGLVLNAQQALEGHDGPRALHVSTTSGTAVTIRIADSGPGIPAEVQARVFEPFFTTKAFGAGGGSGLAVARGIFESHGGTIAIDPAVRSGCAIVVTLPAGEPS
ncbi:MAG: two-component system sensor histidine kinase NtrB [Novosphingobium sp.]